MDQVHATTPAADENILLENIRQMNDIELFSTRISILVQYDNLSRPATLSFKKRLMAMHVCPNDQKDIVTRLILPLKMSLC